MYTPIYYYISSPRGIYKKILYIYIYVYIYYIIYIHFYFLLQCDLWQAKYISARGFCPPLLFRSPFSPLPFPHTCLSLPPPLFVLAHSPFPLPPPSYCKPSSQKSDFLIQATHFINCSTHLPFRSPLSSLILL